MSCTSFAKSLGHRTWFSVCCRDEGDSMQNNWRGTAREWAVAPKRRWSGLFTHVFNCDSWGVWQYIYQFQLPNEEELIIRNNIIEWEFFRCLSLVWTNSGIICIHWNDITTPTYLSFALPSWWFLGPTFCELQCHKTPSSPLLFFSSLFSLSHITETCFHCFLLEQI